MCFECVYRAMILSFYYNGTQGYDVEVIFLCMCVHKIHEFIERTLILMTE